jgi:hypothetical protein
VERNRHVRFVPKADIHRRGISIPRVGQTCEDLLKRQPNRLRAS